MRRLGGLSLLFFTGWVYAAAGPDRQPAQILTDYHGQFQSDFTEQYDRVRLLTRQAQLEISARLGLFQYQEGFRSPMSIRFDDDAPIGIENALAYVRLGKNTDGQFAQELVVNLEATRRNPADFDQVFYHEMTHAVLNDAVGGEAGLKIPHWVQEGLAQYTSGEGDGRLRQAASHLRKTTVGALLCDLEGSYSGLAYPQYYLSIKYLYDRYSSNAIQALVRLLINGKPAREALQEATGVSWARFQQDLRDYSLRTLQDLAPHG